MQPDPNKLIPKQFTLNIAHCNTLLEIQLSSDIHKNFEALIIINFQVKVLRLIYSTLNCIWTYTLIVL